MRRVFILLAGVLLASCAPKANPTDYAALAPAPAFVQLQADIVATSDAASQQQLIDAFWAAHPESPLTDGTTAIFMAQGADSQMLLTGDMTNWLQTIPMQRLGATNVWALTQTLPISARLDYRFAVSGGGIRGLATDPRNPTLVPSALGLNSELRMPAYIAPTEIISRADVPQGRLDNLGVYSSTLSPTTHELVVYLPPGYDASQRYPTVYFQDGDDYRNFAFTPTILDNAIAAGTLPPLIGVFVTPSREQGRQLDYNLNAAYARFFTEELVPLIDTRYATLQDPRWRVVVGDSYGGLISLYIALLRPDLFGGVVNQSGFVSRYGGRLLTLYTAAPTQPVRISTITGTFETCVGGVVTENDCNFLEGNRTLHSVLDVKGYPQQYAEYPQGHAWGFWRDFIDSQLAWVLDYPAQQPPTR